jgi:glycosyltransferase involved in cell wall biosynthesis
MKFSIIIPVFFSHKFIGRCLDSLLSQTVTDDFEIICVGDKVDDPTQPIIEEYKKQYPGIVDLHIQEGRGSGSARNIGLRMAKGEYIMFADADDYVEPTILADCESALRDYDADFVRVGFDRVSSDGRLFSREQSVSEITCIDVTDQNIAILAFISTAPWGKLFKRDIIAGSKFPESPFPCHEDCIFLLSVFPKVKRFVTLPDILYHYIVYDESATTSYTVEKTQAFRGYLIALKEHLEADGVPASFFKMLDVSAFIHVGIADAHRTGENTDVSLRRFCAGAKEYMDTNFPRWRKIKMRSYGRFTLRCKMVWLAKHMYKMNVFWIFIRVYNWMIKTLHIDVKW